MSNAKKYVAASSAPITASDPPEWVRRMSDDYARTGTVRASDAIRLQASQEGTVQLTGSVRPTRNDDGSDSDSDD